MSDAMFRLPHCSPSLVLLKGATEAESLNDGAPPDQIDQGTWRIQKEISIYRSKARSYIVLTIVAGVLIFTVSELRKLMLVEDETSLQGDQNSSSPPV